jgi:hypothetical protein
MIFIHGLVHKHQSLPLNNYMNNINMSIFFINHLIILNADTKH